MHKRKIWLLIVAGVLLVAFFVVPIPKEQYRDGGTREYVALTYRIVSWNRMHADGVYKKICIYFGDDRKKTIDELWEMEQVNVEEKFVATVLEINGETVLVEPVKGEPEQLCSDKISFEISKLETIDVSVGSVVQITYRGGIMESYPAKIKAIRWQISDDLRHMAYTEQWLDKEVAKAYEPGFFGVVRITKIYSDCFFAKTVIPMPYEIKLNGTLSKDWCVGDKVECTYKNAYYDEIGNRVEADMLTIKESDWEPDPHAAYKPVIYLYPEKETEVSVRLLLNGKLTCTYPAYGQGWKVTAMPDGTIKDNTGQSYNYLYWEGETNTQYDLSQGFCIKGQDTAAFLEHALDKLGLTRREANEFIVYWLPMMEQNPYNLISFQTDSYTEAAKLEVDPAPDTMIRVFMSWKRTDQFIKMQEQDLNAPVRRGFTVVEWGGTELK